MSDRYQLPPGSFIVDDPTVPTCSAEACDLPTAVGGTVDLFCESHDLMLSEAATAAIATSTPGTPERHDAVWRACCELATDERRPYRRTLFDGETIDSGH